MKITIVGPNLGMGGVERASSNMANAFSRLKYSITYLALIPEKPFCILDDDVKYIEPKDFNKGSMSLFKTLIYIRKNVKNEQPDVVFAYTKLYGALANLALLWSNYSLYISERSSPFYIWPKHVEIFSKISYGIKKPKGIISQTKIASKFHKEYYGKSSYEVIPNSVKEINFQSSIKRKKWILGVGRFHDSCKGFDQLVKAFNLINNQDWKLVFAGGDEKEGRYLTNLAKDQITKDRILFLGKVSKIDDTYQEAGLFVIPSRKEGFPNALVEAMVAGCACISFNFTAGPNEIISDEVDGILVEDGNIEELAKEIDHLIENLEKREYLGENAKKIISRLNECTIAERYISFFNRCEEI